MTPICCDLPHQSETWGEFCPGQAEPCTPSSPGMVLGGQQGLGEGKLVAVGSQLRWSALGIELMGCSGSCSAKRILLLRGCTDSGSRWSSLRWSEQFLAFPHPELGFACPEVVGALHPDGLRAASSPPAGAGVPHLLHLLHSGKSRPSPSLLCFLWCGCAAH